MSKKPLVSFEVWYQGKFMFNARSVSSHRLKHMLWLYRNWNKEEIELKEWNYAGTKAKL